MLRTAIIAFLFVALLASIMLISFAAGIPNANGSTVTARLVAVLWATVEALRGSPPHWRRSDLDLTHG